MTESLIGLLIERGKKLMDELDRDSEAKPSDKVQLLVAMTRIAALDSKENPRDVSRTGIGRYDGIIHATTGSANGGDGDPASARPRARRTASRAN